MTFVTDVMREKALFRTHVQGELQNVTKTATAKVIKRGGRIQVATGKCRIYQYISYSI